MEGEHEQKIATQVFEFALALGYDVADTEAWVRAWILWQLATVLNSLLEGLRALLYQVWTHLGNSLNHAE